MQLTTKARYGLRALCHVAHRGYASAHVIAEQQAIPSRYLEEIIGELRKAGFVVGKRGPRGGYKLARPAADIQKIDALVKAAIGFNAERGDLVTVEQARFSRDASAMGGTEAKASMFDFGKNDIMRGVELLVLLVTGLLLIFFVLRPLLKAAQGQGQGGGAAAVGPGGVPVTMLQTTEVGGVAGHLAGPGAIDERLDIARVQGQVKASSIKKVADFVGSHPDESASIVRNWVHEG